MPDALQVEIIKAEALDAAAIDLWREWAAMNPLLASPYFRWDYTEIASRVCPGAGLAVFRRGGRIVGFFPYQKRGGTVLPLGAPMNDYHGVIMPAGETISLEDVARLLKAPRLSVQGWVGPAVSGEARDTVQSVMPPEGFEPWYAAQRKAFGKFFKDKERARRSLEAELGAVRVEYGQNEPELLDRLIELKSAQYRRSGLHDIFGCGWTRELLKALMMDPRPDFSGVLTAMYAGNALVAVEFSLLAGRTCHFWFPVYEPSLARCSPGILLSLETMRMASSCGVRVFDFGFAGESYKKYFVNARQTVVEAVVRRPGMANAIGEAAVGVLSHAGARGEALSVSLRRRWATIEACEPSTVGQLRGAAVAARSAVRKVASGKIRSANVAHV